MLVDPTLNPRVAWPHSAAIFCWIAYASLLLLGWSTLSKCTTPPDRRASHSCPAKSVISPRELLINLGIMAHCAFDLGRQYGRAAELRDARLCGQEKAHEARRVSSRDGGGGAVVSTGSSDRAALSEGGSSGRSSSVSDRRDVAHLLPAAVVQSV